VNNISIVDPPLVPNRPSSPRLLINLILALIAGTAVGLGLALALEQIDDAVSDPSEVNDLFNLPSLGAIPNLKDDPRAGLEDRKSDVSEAYLAVQANLAFSTDHGMPKAIAVTSTGPGEGKSITAYALALSLARTGRKTLLIDADMRSPSVHHLAGVANEKGLSNYLSGDNDLDSAIHQTSEKGVFVMTSGPQPPSAAELLAGNRLEALIKQLSGTFEAIVVDAPPVMGLADAPRIASQVEGVVFVVQANATRARSARFSIGRLASSQARILGVVLSRFEARRAYYGHGYAYGYGYGNQAET
jgi:capsular exopolysaccharide synthesis family protein